MINTLFNPQGRIGPNEFWVGWLILFIGNIVTNFIPIIGFAISIGLIYVGICVYGKRLHDAGKSAWMILIPWGLSIVLAIVAFAMLMPTLTAMMADPNVADQFETGNISPETLMSMISGSLGSVGLYLVSIIVWIGFTLWVGLAASDPNENRFGPPPKKDMQTPPTSEPPPAS